MKKTLLLQMIISISLLLSCPQVHFAATDADKGRPIVEEQIWKLEEAYFTSLYNADHDAVLVLVHEQFLGWPDVVSKPLDRQGSSDFMKKAFSKPLPCSLKFVREGIRVIGDVALTQYILSTRCSDVTGAAEERSSRITHTWVKRGSAWKLLGGMSIGIER